MTDDNINRQAAIDYCQALINAENPSDEWNYSQERINQTEVILHHLEVMPPAQPGWIPVTEKPIECGQYIVTLKDDKEVWTDIAEWNPTFGGRWQAEFFDCEYCDIDNVVAWQPLPTPYREGGQDGED